MCVNLMKNIDANNFGSHVFTSEQKCVFDLSLFMRMFLLLDVCV